MCNINRALHVDKNCHPNFSNTSKNIKKKYFFFFQVNFGLVKREEKENRFAINKIRLKTIRTAVHNDLSQLSCYWIAQIPDETHSTLYISSA